MYFFLSLLSLKIYIYLHTINIINKLSEDLRAHYFLIKHYEEENIVCTSCDVCTLLNRLWGEKQRDSLTQRTHFVSKVFKKWKQKASTLHTPFWLRITLSDGILNILFLMMKTVYKCVWFMLMLITSFAYFTACDRHRSNVV